MQKQIYINGQTIEYKLVRKNVKNINLRIKSGCVSVSANIFVPEKLVEDFVYSKADFILKAIERQKNVKCEPVAEYFTADEIIPLIESICQRVYPYFEQRGVQYPKLKYRDMVSRWGSCNASKGILTFNTRLRYAPKDVIEYVVLHEFTHFIQPNHSKKFYDELSKTCPDWKEKRRFLRSISGND